MRLLLSTALLAALPGFASAAEGCFGIGQPLNQGTTKGGSHSLDICLQGNVGVYRYGPKGGEAEMILAQKVEEIHLTPWNEQGSTPYDELEFWVGDTMFQVFFKLERIASDTPDISGGVAEFRADQTPAQIACDAGSVHDIGFDALFDTKTREGQCYAPDGFSWGPCG